MSNNEKIILCNVFTFLNKNVWKILIITDVYRFVTEEFRSYEKIRADDDRLYLLVHTLM